MCHRIEGIISQDVANRGISALVIPGELEAAAASVLACKAAASALAVFTGFPCVTVGDVRTENDGLAGAVAIARAALVLGIPRVTFFTDDTSEKCVSACVAWLCGYGATLGESWDSRLRVSSWPSGPRAWSAAHADAVRAEASACGHAVAIERSGRAADGSYYTMRGRKMDDLVAPLDDAFSSCASTTGIGDGGNEVGCVLHGRLCAAASVDERLLPTVSC